VISEYAPAGSGHKLKKLRRKLGLTQPEVAALARSGISLNKRGQLQARRIQAWEAEKNRIPLATWELLSLKLALIEAGVTTFQELLNSDLAKLFVSKKAESSNPILP
jgi:transcriptional regulator with XRE-family HTH domain